MWRKRQIWPDHLTGSLGTVTPLTMRKHKGQQATWGLSLVIDKKESDMGGFPRASKGRGKLEPQGSKADDRFLHHLKDSMLIFRLSKFICRDFSQGYN